MIALMSFMPYAEAAGPPPLGVIREVASGGAGVAQEQDVAMVRLLLFPQGQSALAGHL